MVSDTFIWDTNRAETTGLHEALLCTGKRVDDIAAILRHNQSKSLPTLLTRLDTDMWQQLPDDVKATLDFDAVSLTAMSQHPAAQPSSTTDVCIVSAGTADTRIAQETLRTLMFYGVNAPMVQDVGVAGLWRLLDNIDAIRQYRLVIAVAGMEGALFSVLNGLIAAPLIAVPTSVGYGVTEGGTTALHSALGSCSPGILTVNINNGFGAACAAIKMLNSFRSSFSIV